MKKLSIVALAALFIVACNEKKEATAANNDRMSDNVKGDVHQVTETPYKTDSTGKMGAMDSCCITTVEYDSAGYFINYSSKDSKGTPGFSQVATHYDNGLFKEFANSNNGKLAQKITIQLDKDGKKYLTAMQYDSAGKFSSFFKDLTQNDYNQLTMMKEYKPDSSLKQSQETEYDKNIFKSQTTKDSSGKEISKTTAKVDDKGNETEVTNTNTMKSPATKKDSTTTKVTKYRYDSFDDQGNWTQRTEMDEKGKATKITKREITYYKK